MTETATYFPEITEDAFAAATNAIASGELIVMPTDTVYGVGADALQPDAVAALLKAKERDRSMPIPVLIAEAAMLPALVADVPLAASDLADAFWPGALTLIFDMAPELGMDLGDANDTIALRVPDHDDARSLLRRTGPLAVSSANKSGEPPTTSAKAARASLGDSVSVYLEAGETPGQAASTIVDFSQIATGQVLRLGVLSFDDLLAVAPDLILSPSLEAEATADVLNADSDAESEKLTDDESASELADQAADPIPETHPESDDTETEIDDDASKTKAD